MREQDLTEMSSTQLQEELEKALQSVEKAKVAYEDACKQGFFARFGEVAKEKKGFIAVAEAYESKVRGALFKANQSETLNSLSKESLDALAMYYDSSNPDTPLSYTGQYAKEQVLRAFENQGLRTDDATFSKIYEYYRFAADEQRAELKQTQLQEQYDNASGLEKVGMNVETIATAPVRGLSAMTEMIEAGIGYHDKNAPLNINDRAFDLTNFNNVVRSETSQDIAEATHNSGVANFAYNTAMSIGDNVMTMTTMAGVGQVGVLTSMGANAASESAKDAMLRGAGVEKTLKTGVASAAVEMVAERIPLDNVMKLATGVGTETVENVIKNMVKQSGIEGTEEAVTSIGNTVTDYAINGDNSHYSLSVESYMESGMNEKEAVMAANKDVVKDMVESATAGFASGGVMGGGAYAVNDVMVLKGESAQAEVILQENDVISQYAELSNEEIYDVLLDRIGNGESVSVQELQNIVATRSVVDPKASEKAMTVFYSGESEELINTLSAKADDKVRVIRRTEAFDFLADRNFKLILTEAVKQDNVKLTGQELENEVSRLLYESSKTEGGVLKEGEGFWTVISRRFAAETKNDAYSLCTNAAEDRIFSRDELRTWLANAPEGTKMAGITKEELSVMSQGKDQFGAVKVKTIQDMKDTTLYFNEIGIKVGQTFGGTSLEGYVEDIIPEQSSYTVTMDKYVQYLRDDEMQAKLGDSYKSLSGLEKLYAREKEYSDRISKVDDLFKPKEKLKLYRDSNGNIQFGEPEKLIITKGLNGEYEMGKGIIKDIENSLEKVSLKEFVR